MLREYILRIVDEWGAAHGGEQERAEKKNWRKCLTTSLKTGSFILFCTGAVSFT